MSISITAVALLLTFNVIGILEEDLNINQDIKPKGLTGLAVENEDQENQQPPENQQEENKKTTNQLPKKLSTEPIGQQGELYTTGSYFIYVIIIGILSLSIIALITRLVLPRIKKFT
jgi:ABC-type lipoprotein release transport system permease subunit